MNPILITLLASLSYCLGYLGGSGAQINKQEKQKNRRRAYNQERQNQCK